MVGPPDSHVDILLSTYNGARWLPALLDSIRAQTHESWTLHVRDDGSTDDTLALIGAAADLDSRIRIHPDSEGNLGPAASFMHMLDYVEADFFAFCDQDDTWRPTKLESSIAAIPANEIAGVYTDAVTTDADGREQSPSAFADRGVPDDGQVDFGKLLINNAAIGATFLGTHALARRAAAIANGRPVLMHDWWVALVSAHQGALRGLTEATIEWRRHPATVTGTTPAGIRARAARRREYLAWSIEAATWLAANSPGASPDNDRAVHALSAMKTRPPTVAGLWHAARVGNVRAWSPRAQFSLAFSVMMRRRP